MGGFFILCGKMVRGVTLLVLLFGAIASSQKTSTDQQTSTSQTTTVPADSTDESTTGSTISQSTTSSTNTTTQETTTLPSSTNQSTTTATTDQTTQETTTLPSSTSQSTTTATTDPTTLENYTALPSSTNQSITVGLLPDSISQSTMAQEITALVSSTSQFPTSPPYLLTQSTTSLASSTTSSTSQSTSSSTESITQPATALPGLTSPSTTSLSIPTTVTSARTVVQQSVSTTSTTMCKEEVISYETARRCGSSTLFEKKENQTGSRALTESQASAFKDFISSVSSLPTERLMANETKAIAELVLTAFSELTNPDQLLTTGEELSVVGSTEVALEKLAETLPNGSCTSIKYLSSNAALCHSTSLQELTVYNYTLKGAQYESLNFDLSKADPNAENFTLVIFRKKNTETEDGNEKKPRNLRSSSQNSSTRVNSALLSFSFSVGGIRQSVPVDFSLNNLAEAYNQPFSIQGKNGITRTPTCVFWRPDDQEWSTWGCETVRDQSSSFLTQCSCNHSTTFAVLMQVVSDDSNSKALTLITYIGCGASIAGSVLTLSIYCYLWRMLRSDRIFIHANLSIAILAAQILFIAGIDRVKNKAVCTVIAFFLHFFYLSVFGWMLVEGVHLYMKVVKVYGSENIKMYRYVLIGWVTPAVICSISVAVNSQGYGTERSCWLDTESGTIWAFLAPALLVITFNTFVLAMVLRIVIYSTKLHQEKQFDHIKAGLKGALVLLPILGMTWLFGMLAFNSATIVFQYLFVILNSFQGLFIFLIYCVFNSEVKAAFVRKRGTRKHGWGKSSASTIGHTSKQATELTNLSSPTDRGRTDEDGPVYNFVNQGSVSRIETPVLPTKPKVSSAAIDSKPVVKEASVFYDPRGLVGFDDDYECCEPPTGREISTFLEDSISSMTGSNTSLINSSSINQQEMVSPVSPTNSEDVVSPVSPTNTEDVVSPVSPTNSEDVVSPVSPTNSDDLPPTRGRCSSDDSDYFFLPVMAELGDVDQTRCERASSSSSRLEDDANRTSGSSPPDNKQMMKSMPNGGSISWRYW